MPITLLGISFIGPVGSEESPGEAWCNTKRGEDTGRAPLGGSNQQDLIGRIQRGEEKRSLHGCH